MDSTAQIKAQEAAEQQAAGHAQMNDPQAVVRLQQQTPAPRAPHPLTTGRVFPTSMAGLGR